MDILFASARNCLILSVVNSCVARFSERMKTLSPRTNAIGLCFCFCARSKISSISFISVSERLYLCEHFRLKVSKFVLGLL